MIPFYLFSEICQHAPNPYKIKGFCHFFNLLSLLFIRFYKKYPWIVNTFFYKGSFSHSFAQKLFSIFQNFVIIYFWDARVKSSKPPWAHGWDSRAEARLLRQPSSPHSDVIRIPRWLTDGILPSAPGKSCVAGFTGFRGIRQRLERARALAHYTRKNASCQWGMAAGQKRGVYKKEGP